MNTKLSSAHAAHSHTLGVGLLYQVQIKFHIRQTWFSSEVRISLKSCSWLKSWQDGAWDGSACCVAWWTPTCSPPPPLPHCLPSPRRYSSPGIRVQRQSLLYAALAVRKRVRLLLWSVCVVTGSGAVNSLCWELLLECREEWHNTSFTAVHSHHTPRWHSLTAPDPVSGWSRKLQCVWKTEGHAAMAIVSCPV